jgi:hypothetical protein
MPNPVSDLTPEVEVDTYAALLTEVLPEGWEHDADTYGMDCTLTCPHGNELEQDGFSPRCGCRSPLLGVIL